MSERLSPITEADVRRLASEQSFNRGASYYRSGTIFEPVRQGNELRAYCHGSSYEPYRVSATLGPQGVATTHCTCPYDWGGICKHMVALLLTWVHEPEAFQAVAPLEEALAGRSKEELIALIQEMLKREPDLVRLLELPVRPDRQAPLDLDVFRRQINYALRREYSDVGELGIELSAIVETADRFQEGGDWANAGALYHLILDEIVPDYETLYDQEGEISFVLGQCVEGLDACLGEGSPDGETRRAWLEALLEAKLKDVEMGGMDLAYPAGDVVIDHATDAEWAWIEARVRQVIAGRQDSFSQWRRETLVGFLARRLEVTGQEAKADDLVFELGSPQQRAFQLVRLGRFEEAVAIAREHFTDLPGLVERFADALVEAGVGSIAEAYITSQLESRSRGSYLSWLAQYAEKRGDLGSALGWWRQHFHESPSLQTYQALRDVGGRLDRWAQVRPELLQELESGQKWHVLIEIALDEGDVAWALDLLPRMQRWYGGDYELRVAQAAEADYPQAALDIYRRRVERLIGARGRGNYRAAAELLVRARELYRRMGVPADWERTIADLRERHRRLPALRDELNKAGL
jgi:uncharacterized Zn finger protein